MTLTFDQKAEIMVSQGTQERTARIEALLTTIPQLWHDHESKGRILRDAREALLLHTARLYADLMGLRVDGKLPANGGSEWFDANLMANERGRDMLLARMQHLDPQWLAQETVVRNAEADWAEVKISAKSLEREYAAQQSLLKLAGEQLTFLGAPV